MILPVSTSKEQWLIKLNEVKGIQIGDWEIKGYQNSYLDQRYKFVSGVWAQEN